MKPFNRIIHYFKLTLEAINNQSIKKNLFYALPFWIGAFVAGAIAVLYAKLFNWVEMASGLLFDQNAWVFFILTPLCFILAWWMVVRYSPFSGGSGVPQVSASIELATPKQSHRVNHFLSIKVMLVKILSSFIMVFGGGAIGREGPTIQISAAIFNKLNDLLPNSFPKIPKRTMIVSGAAAGLAAAFNTPLGGIVFAIEELTKTHFNLFKSALLTAVIISGLTALSILGPYLYLGYPTMDGISAWIVLSIIPLATITGLTGGAMGKAILYIFKKTKELKSQRQHILYLGACGLVMAALAVFVNQSIFGSGKDIMISALFSDQKHLEWYVPLLRVFGSIISFTSGGAGGIFAPSLSLGSAIGEVFAGIFDFTSGEANLIILCGMTGVLTGITRSPFTSSILVLEMTDSHSVIFYILLAALIANLIASAISGQSFYDIRKDQYLENVNNLENVPLETSTASP